jgi:hypothetical protein
VAFKELGLNGMKEGKSAKFNLQQQSHQNGHLSPFKLAKLLDPEASWDKVKFFNFESFLLHDVV